VVLFSDATIVTETPPLRACWPPVGGPAAVPITGSRCKRVLYGALSARTGTACPDEAGRWNQQTFQGHPRHVRSVWRGWHIGLFVDRGSPPTAKASRARAKELGIELRLLPAACPELNPLGGLWRYIKGELLADEPTPDLDEAPGRACEVILDMDPTERMQVAGVMSGNFWLPT
jgi:hypothetical protein